MVHFFLGYFSLITLYRVRWKARKDYRPRLRRRMLALIHTQNVQNSLKVKYKNNTIRGGSQEILPLVAKEKGKGKKIQGQN